MTDIERKKIDDYIVNVLFEEHNKYMSEFFGVRVEYLPDGVDIPKKLITDEYRRRVVNSVGYAFYNCKVAIKALGVAFSIDVNPLFK